MSVGFTVTSAAGDVVTMLRRERILTATGLAAEQFLEVNGRKDAFGTALRLLGEATAVSRVYVFQEVTSSDGRSLWSQRHEWCADGIEPQIDNPDLQDLCMVDAGFARWVEELAAGRPVFGPVRDFPESERPLLLAQGIRSLVVMPVQTHGKLWGMIGFDDCVDEQGWNPAIVGCLQVAARVIGAACERSHYKAHRDDLLRDYEILLDSVREVIFRVNSEGCWTFLSPAWRDLTGWGIKESLGRNWLDFLEPEFVDSARQTLAHLLTGQGEASRWEGRLRLASGEGRWISVNGRRLPVSPERGTEIVGTLVDVDDAKRSEFALIKAKQEAEAANRGKSEFLSTMSHELRTPLNAVIGLAESLIEDGADLEVQRTQRYLEIIHRSGKQLLSQINDLLDVARIEAGQIRLAPVRLELAALCASCVEAHQRAAQAKQLSVGFGPPSGEILVMADERLLRQALNNLLSNAIKFTPAGGAVVVELKVTGSDTVVLTVRDTGIGIPAEKLSLLFKPFSQIDSSLSRKYGGTGLGLTLVDRLVRMHGGKVDVTSAVGRGSAFSIELSLAPTSENEVKP